MYIPVIAKGATKSLPLWAASSSLWGSTDSALSPQLLEVGTPGKMGQGGEAEKKDSTWAGLCAAWSQPLLTQPVRKGLLVLLSQPQWRTGPQRAQRSCPRGRGKETMCVDRCSVLGTSLSSSSAGGYHSPHVTEEEIASER